MEYLSHILFASAMATCAGFRAFLPLLALSVGVHFGIIDKSLINPDAAFITKNVVVLVFLIFCTLFEILSDKSTALDSFIDSVFMFFRPFAGMLLAFCLLNFPVLIHNVIGGIIIGSVFTIALQYYKSTARAFGYDKKSKDFNFVLSFVEDIEALGGCVMALVVPSAAFVFLPVLYYSTVFAFKKLQQKANLTGRKRKKKRENEPDMEEIKLTTKLKKK